MTTSFPPISYPSKPVPPFTAEPPRNQFPGFFPDMWKNITGKPYITVSSKGLANGLSEYFNDGADFGPDSLQSDGSPTETSGWQEAETYAGSIARYSSTGTGYILPEVRLLDGKFTLNADVTLPTFPNAPNSIPSFSIKGNGYGGYEAGTYIDIATGHKLIIGTPTGIQTSEGGFLIQGLTGNILTIVVQGRYATNPNIIVRDIGGVIFDLSNAYNIAQIAFDNIFTATGATSTLGGAFQLSATNLTLKGGLAFGNASNTANSNNPSAVNQVGVVNMAEGIQINYGDISIDFAVWELDANGTVNAGVNGITNNVPSGDTFTLNINVGTMVINTTENFFLQNTGAGTLNIKMHIKHLTFQTAVNDWTVPSGINIEEFTVDEITNLTSTATSSANLPIISSASGTTAGTVNMRFSEYASSHKKMYITFSGYENDTTTKQTIDFPMKLNSNAGVAVNDTGLTIAASTTGITITAPDSTTTYSGIVIVEGY